MRWSSWDATGTDTAVDHRALFEFDLNGFIVVRNALSAARVAQMNAALEGSSLFQEEVVERQRGDGTRFTFCQTDPMFMELLEHPVMLEFLVRALSGQSAQARAPVLSAADPACCRCFCSATSWANGSAWTTPQASR